MKLTERQTGIIKKTFLDYQQTSAFLDNPLILKNAKGLYYWDTDGKRYFDAIGGIFVASLGHCHPRVVEALKCQLDKMTFAPPLHGIADITLDFIEKLGSVSPGDLKYVKPYSGGSESIESAMKFVRQYFKQTGHTGKYKFISRYFGYHGSTFGAMSASGTGKRKTKFEPNMAGFLKVFPPNYWRDRFSSWEQCNRFSAEMFEDVIINEDPETVAGVIIEPIGNTGGIITPTDEYFQIIRNICDRHNVILIYDEVITGFGKTGNMFAAQTFGVIPDIICSGKGLSSGTIPMGAMIANESMADAFFGDVEDDVQFAHGNTYAGNPLACAVGIAVIDEIVEKQLDKKAQRLGKYLFEKLETLKKYGVVREVRGKGILLGVELVKDTKTNSSFPELGKMLKKTALKNGLIMRIDPSWFAVAPALIAEKSDIDEMFELIDKSLKDAIQAVK
ncbi:MAG TPA: aminotransferase class III-fold pyridoxal phosphate-dependent enzyme [Sedimentisphaerales bacterium]|nr:aminotransferase class III-fold pyridoxal phosphate-dependent enzyme [Sedimentisphaerales bacterium]